MNHQRIKWLFFFWVIFLILYNTTRDTSPTNSPPKDIKITTQQYYNILEIRNNTLHNPIANPIFIHQPPSSHNRTFYKNISSFLSGNVVLSNQSTTDNLSVDITFDSSETALFDEIKEVSGHLYLTKLNKFNLFGFYNSIMGHGILIGAVHDTNYTLPYGYLPSMISNQTKYYTQIFETLNAKLQQDFETASKSIERGVSTIGVTVPDSYSAEDCFYLIYFDVDGFEEIRQIDLDIWENELSNPTGVPTIKSPSISLNLTMRSPNCMQSNTSRTYTTQTHIRGLRKQVFYNKLNNFGFWIFGMVTFIEIMLTINQLNYTASQSALFKISLATISLHTLLDSLICLYNLGNSLTSPFLFKVFCAGTFLKFVLFSVYEMRYLLNIAKAQQGLQNTNDNYVYEVYMRYFVYPFIVIYVGLKYIVELEWVGVCVGLILYSFWIPQIVRFAFLFILDFLVSNIMKNTRKCFTWRYVIGISLCRLMFPLYRYAWPDSIDMFGRNHSAGNGIWIALLVLYVFIQVCVLLMQDFLGARAFIPIQLLPRAYNYHPVFTAEDLESHTAQTEPLFSTSEGNPALTNKDCAICHEQVDIVPCSGESSFGFTQGYMVTPCHHLFHTDCLERWMEVKLICPVCRTELPHF